MDQSTIQRHMLIKPASSLCNLRCRYCFYADVAANREVPSYGMMSLETAENLVRKALADSVGSATFAFQGGEPTLRGLDFFRDFVAFVRKYNVKDIPIAYALQTNGFTIDDEWAAFFAENKFLLGVSLDGTVRSHNRNRIDANKEGTFKTVWSHLQILQTHGVEFNILTVVSADVARAIDKIYPFYMEKGLYYQQYIPCLDPLGEERGQYDYSLTPELYGDFLIKLFDMWAADIKRGQFVYNRFFENLVGMLKGYPPESCGMVGTCQPQLVLEADGSVYPCDFYVLDELKLGNINEDDFADFERRRNEIGFIEQSAAPDPECLQCPYAFLCRGGCRRDREPQQDEHMSLNYFCPAFKRFYAHALPVLREIASRIA